MKFLLFPLSLLGLFGIHLEWSPALSGRRNTLSGAFFAKSKDWPRNRRTASHPGSRSSFVPRNDYPFSPPGYIIQQAAASCTPPHMVENIRSPFVFFRGNEHRTRRVYLTNHPLSPLFGRPSMPQKNGYTPWRLFPLFGSAPNRGKRADAVRPALLIRVLSCSSWRKLLSRCEECLAW
jgi:hypothetical protein